jgi:hypothetical protein
LQYFLPVLLDLGIEAIRHHPVVSVCNIDTPWHVPTGDVGHTVMHDHTQRFIWCKAIPFYGVLTLTPEDGYVSRPDVLPSAYGIEKLL